MNVNLPLLECLDLDKNYGSTAALKKVSLIIKSGEVLGLVGENGAGKSTLTKVLCGSTKPDSGTLIVGDKKVRFRSPKDALENGISVISQEIQLVPKLNVIDNVLLGFDDFKINDKKLSKLDYYKYWEDFVGYHFPPTTKVSTLSVASQQKVEILRAVSRKTKLIIMDEPTAALTIDESTKLHETILKLKSQGITIIYISHYLKDILQVSDRIAVMRDGKLINIHEKSKVDETGLISDMIGGQLIKKSGNRGTIDKSLTVIKVENISTNKIKNIDFYLSKGEILGFAGLVGSGRTEIARALFGADKISEGAIFINGEAIKEMSPLLAKKYRMFMISEDRKTQGLFLANDVTFNLFASTFNKHSKFSFLFGSTLKNIADDLTKQIDLRFNNLKQKVSALSGGNQQKVLFARAIEARPEILIIDEPTRGVDVAAKRSIHEIIKSLAAAGISVIVISSEIEEVVELSDRILVVSDGQIINEFIFPFEQEEILKSFFQVKRG